MASVGRRETSIRRREPHTAQRTTDIKRQTISQPSFSWRQLCLAVPVLAVCFPADLNKVSAPRLSADTASPSITATPAERVVAATPVEKVISIPAPGNIDRLTLEGMQKCMAEVQKKQFKRPYDTALTKSKSAWVVPVDLKTNFNELAGPMCHVTFSFDTKVTEHSCTFSYSAYGEKSSDNSFFSIQSPPNKNGTDIYIKYRETGDTSVRLSVGTNNEIKKAERIGPNDAYYSKYENYAPPEPVEKLISYAAQMRGPCTEALTQQ